MPGGNFIGFNTIHTDHLLTGLLRSLCQAVTIADLLLYPHHTDGSIPTVCFPPEETRLSSESHGGGAELGTAEAHRLRLVLHTSLFSVLIPSPLIFLPSYSIPG